MSEQTERAEAALREAGFVEGRPSGYYVNIRAESVDKVWIRDNSFTIETTRQLSDLPSLLNPLTLERVREVVRAEIRHRCETDMCFETVGRKQWHEFEKAILARLSGGEPT